MLGSALGKLGSIDINLLMDRMNEIKGHTASKSRNPDSVNPISVSWEGEDELVSVQPYPRAVSLSWVFCRVTVRGKYDWDYLDTYIPAIPTNHGWTLHPTIGLVPDGDRLLSVAVGSGDMPLSVLYSPVGGGGTYEDIKLNSYMVNDLSLNYNLWGTYNVFFDVINIFDKKYNTALQYSQMDRSFNFGIRRSY